MLAAFSALAQQAPSVNTQRAAIARQRETVRRQAESAGATLLPALDGEVMVSAISAVEPACDALPTGETDPLIESAAKTNNVKPELIRAVIARESAFRPCAVSVKGAQGLMQLMPASQAQFGVTDAFDPKQNIEAGARLLKQLLEKYKGDLRLALAAYNAGPAAVDSAGRIPDIAETQEYVRFITTRLENRPN
jgi:soluble lytic murein transglycosylase-like protein